MDWAQFQNFSEGEFRCPGTGCCGGKCDMHDEILGIIQSIRTSLGTPLTVSSGYRCSQHNNKISHTGFSGPHTTGKAVDLLVSQAVAFQVIKMGLLLGVTGLGVSQKGTVAGRFVHLDTVDRTPHKGFVWSY